MTRLRGENPLIRSDRLWQQTASVLLDGDRIQILPRDSVESAAAFPPKSASLLPVQFRAAARDRRRLTSVTEEDVPNDTRSTLAIYDP